MIEFYHIDQHKKQVLAFDMDHTIYNYYPNLHICPFKKKPKMLSKHRLLIKTNT